MASKRRNGSLSALAFPKLPFRTVAKADVDSCARNVCFPPYSSYMTTDKDGHEVSDF